MALRGVATDDAINFKRNDLAIKSANDGMQRAHPAQSAGAPAHGFRPWEIADHLGQQFRDHVLGSAALLLDGGHIEFALLRVILHGHQIHWHASGFDEAFDGGGRCIQLGAFAFFHGVSGFISQAFDG